MKSAAILFSFIVALSVATAQETVSPAQRTELFNGTNFNGFTFASRGTNPPAGTWSIANHLIHCTGTPAGYLRTTNVFSNCVVTVVWRFVKIAPKKDNTGVLVHMQLPDQVWPVCVQNQGKSGRQGDLFVMAGAECKEHLALGKDANTPVAFKGAPNENAIGEWNTNVTVCVGDKIWAIINGKTLNKITECTVSSGFIGIQSEGAEIEIRKISAVPLNINPDHQNSVYLINNLQGLGLSDILDAKLRADERAKRELR